LPPLDASCATALASALYRCLCDLAPSVDPTFIASLPPHRVFVPDEHNAHAERAEQQIERGHCRRLFAAWPDVLIRRARRDAGEFFK